MGPDHQSIGRANRLTKQTDDVTVNTQEGSRIAVAAFRVNQPL
jgi:hypothetical protein